MNKRRYIMTASIVFGLVSVLHLMRAINGLPLLIGVWEAPIWLSWGAALFAGFMSVVGFGIVNKK